MFGGGFFGGGGDGGGFFGAGMPGRFDQQYQAFPVSFAGKEELEKGNKLILPQSALDHLARLNISYPMLFEISNLNASRKTHGGVQEFVAEEGTCYMPYWMMCNLLLTEGDLVRITNTSLPKGRFVKIQPVSSDFLDIHNPRAVLENALRNFATLTIGDCIVINYNQKKYEIEIVETKPAPAISIIEVDVDVDFAPPKDYKEPTQPMQDVTSPSSFQQKEMEEEAAAQEESPSKFSAFGGAGQRVDGKPIKTPTASPAFGPSSPPTIDEDVEMPWKKRIPGGVKWTTAPFHFGTGHMSSTADKQRLADKRAQDLGVWDGKGQTLQ